MRTHLGSALTIGLFLVSAACSSSSGGGSNTGGGGAATGGVCKPGATQVCAGPGACNGAQVCGASGASWGACDCGGGGSGGGAGAPQCSDVGFTVPACNACAHASCCSQILTCLGETSCHDLVKCVQGCGSSACTNACVSASSDGATQFEATIGACLAPSGACGAACGAGSAGAAGAGGTGGGADSTIVGAFPDPPACHDCLATMSGILKVGGGQVDCGKVTAACGPNDEKCGADALCIASYRKAHPKDPLDCAVDKCLGVVPESNDFFVCAADRCGAQCGLTVGFMTTGCGM